MNNAQAIAFVNNHIEGMQEFIGKLQNELLTSDKLDKHCIIMPALGLPLEYELGHYGDIISANQTGTLGATLTADRLQACKVASSIRDGKGNAGRVATYQQLLTETIEKQQESIATCQREIDNMKATD